MSSTGENKTIPEKKELKLPQNLKNFKPTLKLESKTFVPSTIPKIELSPVKKQEDDKVVKMEIPTDSKLNLNAPIFKPLVPVPVPEQSKAAQRKAKNEAKKARKQAAAQEKAQDGQSNSVAEPSETAKPAIANNKKKYQVKGSSGNPETENKDEQKKEDVKKEEKSAEKPPASAELVDQKQAQKDDLADRKPPSDTKAVSHKIIPRSQKKISRGGATAADSAEETKKVKKDPLQNYQPPFRAKQEKKPQQEKDGEQKKERKVYTLEFIFSYRQNNKQRPTNMAELDFPHKKRGTNVNGFRKKPLTEKDKFNKMVGEIRILLNKLSSTNFETISTKLL